MGESRQLFFPAEAKALHRRKRLGRILLRAKILRNSPSPGGTWNKGRESMGGH